MTGQNKIRHVRTAQKRKGEKIMPRAKKEDITLTAIFERDSSIGILTYIPNKEYLNPSPNGKVFIYNSLYESL